MHRACSELAESLQILAEVGDPSHLSKFVPCASSLPVGEFLDVVFRRCIVLKLCAIR